MTPKEISQAYIQAFARRDQAGMRQLLAEEDFSFEGPLEKLSDREALLASLKKLDPLGAEITVKQTVAENDIVCTLYDFKTQVPAIGTTRIAEIHQIKNEKIKTISLYFDPRPYAAMLD